MEEGERLLEEFRRNVRKNRHGSKHYLDQLRAILVRSTCQEKFSARALAGAVALCELLIDRRCPSCLAGQKRNSEYRQARVAAGFCHTCKRKRQSSTSQNCNECKERVNRRRREARRRARKISLDSA